MHAFTYDFSVFENADDADVSPISIQGTLTQNGDDVDLTISNTSSGGWATNDIPTITQIAFDDANGQLDSTGASATTDVEFAANDSTLPGGNNIDFETTFGYKAVPPPTTKGIDPGESYTVTIGNIDTSQLTVADLQQLIELGDLSVGLHVQQVGADGEFSVSYVIPEPSSAMLMSLAGFAIFLRRKR